MGTIYDVPVLVNNPNPTFEQLSSSGLLLATHLQGSTDLYAAASIAGVKMTAYPFLLDEIYYYQFDFGYTLPFTSYTSNYDGQVSKISASLISTASYPYSLLNSRYVRNFPILQGKSTVVIDMYENQEQANMALANALPINGDISYRLTNCSAPNAPTTANVGDTVTVNLAFPNGYGIASASDVYVTLNGTIISSNYDNGVITFTMPAS